MSVTMFDQKVYVHKYIYNICTCNSGKNSHIKLNV